MAYHELVSQLVLRAQLTTDAFEQMTHCVHAERGVMLQDTEGEHRGGTQILLLP